MEKGEKQGFDSLVGSTRVPEILVDHTLVICEKGLRATVRVLSVPPIELDAIVRPKTPRCVTCKVPREVLVDALGPNWERILIDAIDRVVDAGFTLIIATPNGHPRGSNELRLFVTRVRIGPHERPFLRDLAARAYGPNAVRVF